MYAGILHLMIGSIKTYIKIIMTVNKLLTNCSWRDGTTNCSKTPRSAKCFGSYLYPLFSNDSLTHLKVCPQVALINHKLKSSLWIFLQQFVLRHFMTITLFCLVSSDMALMSNIARDFYTLFWPWPWWKQRAKQTGSLRSNKGWPQ